MAIISQTVQLWIQVFWVISVQFNIRNALPKSGTFLLGHPIYICIYIYIYLYSSVCTCPFIFNGLMLKRSYTPKYHCLILYFLCISSDVIKVYTYLYNLPLSSYICSKHVLKGVFIGSQRSLHMVATDCSGHVYCLW